MGSRGASSGIAKTVIRDNSGYKGEPKAYFVDSKKRPEVAYEDGTKSINIVYDKKQYYEARFDYQHILSELQTNGEKSARDLAEYIALNVEPRREFLSKLDKNWKVIKK